VTTPIESIDVSVFTIPLDAPESDGTLTWTETTVVVVEPVAGGVRGLGFTYGPDACAPYIRHRLAPVVLGLDAFDVPRAWSAMVRSLRNDGRPGVASMAVAAVDISLWDLKAKLLDLPLGRLLGAVRDAVPVYGSGGFTSLSDADLAAQLGGWVHDDAIPRVKMKIGTGCGADERRDRERVVLARRSIGDDAELYVDANGAYAAKQAVRLARSFGDLDVTWFEEPVSSDDLDGLRVVRDAVDLEVAAGEYGYDLPYFERLAGVVDVLQADASRCAGITEWLRVAAVAAAHGLDLSGHCAPLLHRHAALAVPNVRHLEWFADHVRADGRLFDPRVEPRNGALGIDTDRPGLGLELRLPDALAHRR
jgi:L-alanine-DL-glutamate epimerase-like enolase superfamily enzyme